MSVLWSKGSSADKIVQEFTVGRDREFDILLAASDIKGSVAHVKMLASVGLLEAGFLLQSWRRCLQR